MQRALTASSARASAQNPALAELVRKSQDLEKQIGAQLGLLNNVLALPPEERDDKAVKTLQADIDKLRSARDAAKRELAGKFRDYASLVEPAPPIGRRHQGRHAGRRGVPVVLFRPRRRVSCGRCRRAGRLPSPPSRSEPERSRRTIAKLREALEPNAAMVSDIPPFDVALAHELYTQILKPVEAGWRPAKNLIVATNGALGLLPLGLLPTAPAAVKTDTEVAFLRLSRRAVARAHACGDAGAVGGGAAHVAAIAAGLGQARTHDRIRRSAVQQGAGQRGDRSRTLLLRPRRSRRAACRWCGARRRRRKA